MYVVQILLPLYDNAGLRFGSDAYAPIHAILTTKFGGLTAYSRAPAEGAWDSAGRITREDIVVFEVMAQHLDRHWWASYRLELEARFRQDSVVIRAQNCELL